MTPCRVLSVTFWATLTAFVRCGDGNKVKAFVLRNILKSSVTEQYVLCAPMTLSVNFRPARGNKHEWDYCAVSLLYRRPLIS